MYNVKKSLKGGCCMGTAGKIRVLLIKRNMKIKDLAESLGYRQRNFSNKLKKDDFSEKELRQIAEILDCEFEMTFTMKDTGEKI